MIPFLKILMKMLMISVVQNMDETDDLVEDRTIEQSMEPVAENTFVDNQQVQEKYRKKNNCRNHLCRRKKNGNQSYYLNYLANTN